MTKLNSRKQRRLDARLAGTKFQPHYSSGVNERGQVIGGPPKTHEELTGVGYERFNSKYVTIAEAK